VTLANHRQADFDRYERVISGLDAVVACWSVGGGVDYVLKVTAPDIDSYQRFVDGLLDREIGIERYFTYIVTKTVKEELAQPLDRLLPDPG
jgi:Lrp/AsnC family transcriptional regulator of ectoine degradation